MTEYISWTKLREKYEIHELMEMIEAVQPLHFFTKEKILPPDYGRLLEIEAVYPIVLGLGVAGNSEDKNYFLALEKEQTILKKKIEKRTGGDETLKDKWRNLDYQNIDIESTLGVLENAIFPKSEVDSFFHEKNESSPKKLTDDPNSLSKLTENQKATLKYHFPQKRNYEMALKYLHAIALREKLENEGLNYRIQDIANKLFPNERWENGNNTHRKTLRWLKKGTEIRKSLKND